MALARLASPPHLCLHLPRGVGASGLPGHRTLPRLWPPQASIHKARLNVLSVPLKRLFEIINLVISTSWRRMTFFFNGFLLALV